MFIRGVSVKSRLVSSGLFCSSTQTHNITQRTSSSSSFPSNFNFFIHFVLQTAQTLQSHRCSSLSTLLKGGNFFYFIAPILLSGFSFLRFCFVAFRLLSFSVFIKYAWMSVDKLILNEFNFIKLILK